MSSRTRDNLLAIVLFLVMGAITAVAVVQELRAQAVDPPLASFSTQPNGALALSRWFDRLGFSTSNDVDALFGVPETADLVLILEPTEQITLSDWELIDEWIDNGGTLIFGGTSFQSYGAFEHFDVVLDLSFDSGVPTIDTPLTFSPPIPALPEQETVRYLNATRADVVPLVTVNGRPVMLTFTQGEGRVILTTLMNAFSNRGLQQDGYGELILNIIGEPEGDIWFDEWHHGVRVEESAFSGNWLQRTPIGRAILYTIIIVFIWLLLRGRNFGRPVPLRKDVVRRSPMEYVTAVANISRKAGHRAAVLRDTHDRLKRDLSSRYRLSPTLPDNEFVEQLATYNPRLDKAELLMLLTNLSARTVTEEQLLKLMQDAANYVE